MPRQIPKQVEQKDRGLNAASILGDSFSALKSRLQQEEIKQLYKSSDLDVNEWRGKQISSFLAFKKKIDKELVEGKKTLKNVINEQSKRLSFTEEQRVELLNAVNTEVDRLGVMVADSHRRMINYVPSQMTVLQSVSANKLFDTITKHVSDTNNKVFDAVVYKNGKAYKWESYMEMKVRTDIQQEITNDFINTGIDTENVFYTCSYYGDSREPHSSIQEKGLFYEESWESFNLPESVKNDIGNYIKAHKLMSIQEAMGEAGNYFTTSPNCRHYFQFISIEDVLGMKNNEDVRNYQKKNDLASDGEYNKEKYDALQEQRRNERAIRNLKDKRDREELAIENAKKNKIDPVEIGIMENKLRVTKSKIKDWQGKQRELIKNNSNLERQYDREKNGNVIVNLGVKKR